MFYIVGVSGNACLLSLGKGEEIGSRRFHAPQKEP